MKPWKLAALLATGWFVLMIALGVIHTELLIADITPERDAAISEAYGQAAALGAIALGVIGYQYRKRHPSR